MAYRYTYAVVDPALRNFLLFVLVLLVTVSAVAAVGTTLGVFELTPIDLLDRAQTMTLFGSG